MAGFMARTKRSPIGDHTTGTGTYLFMEAFHENFKFQKAISEYLIEFPKIRWLQMSLNVSLKTLFIIYSCVRVV